MIPDLPPALQELLVTQHGVATSAQLIKRGFSERRIATATRRGQFIRLHRGAYAVAERWTRAEPRARHCLRLLATQLAAPDAIGIECTAATVWGWPVRHLPDLPIVAREPGLGNRCAGASVRRVSVEVREVAHRHGLTITSRERTALNVAAESEFIDALITVDAAFREGLTPTSVLNGVGGGEAVRRRAHIVRVLEAGDPASESALESISRGQMIMSELPLPLCNVVLICDGRVYRVDFLWVEFGVVGECDGKTKYRDFGDATEVLWREKRRQELIEEWTFRVARWGYAEAVNGGEPMLRRISQAVDTQRRLGFTWPSGVRAEVRTPRGATSPPHVVAEVLRLQRLGYPIKLLAEVEDQW